MLNMQLSNKEMISYKKVGNGDKVMVMIHGNICSGLHFNPIISYLPKDYTVYIPDLRGFGQSSYINRINEIDDLSKDVHEFVTQLNIESFILLGWSAGGCVCMDYASNYPEKVESLILVESVGYKGCPMLDENNNVYPNRESMKYEPTQVMPVLDAINNNDADFIEELWDNAVYVNKKPNKKDIDKYVQASLKQRNLLDIYWALSKFNISNENNRYAKGNGKIKNINVPVILTWGENDNIVSKKEIYETAKALNSKSKVIILKDCGHSPFLDCPEYLMNQIEKFTCT